MDVDVHEKGGVKNSVGRFRRARLVPVPKVTTIVELNRLLQRVCEQDKERVIAGQSKSVENRWQTEIDHLLKLPDFCFESFEICLPVISNKSLATPSR